MSNYSVLQHNTMHGFSETASVLYLDLVDKLQCEKKAFFAACKYEEKLGILLEKLFTSYFELDKEVLIQLSTFFAKRYMHNFMERTWKK